jgi:tetratricopeptide (TPR) repeat protein
VVARKYEAAKDIQKTALEMRERTLGPDHPGTLKSMADLALTYKALGCLPLAEQMFRKILAIDKPNLGDSHAGTIEDMRTLASSLQDQANYAEAEELFRQARALKIEKVEPRHPDAMDFQGYLAGCPY